MHLKPQKLENLVENLETVEALVYDLGIEDTTLDKLEKLPDLDKLELLMSKVRIKEILRPDSLF